METNQPHFRRAVGLWPAVAINMTQICGIGPFVTIPLMLTAMGGPQAMLGWIAGALLAMCDGLVWAELGAAMPGAGGSYLYLREAFQYSSGRLMPFLFVWSVLLVIPLTMSTGVIGLVQYLGYYHDMSLRTQHLLSVGVCIVTVIVLYRDVSTLGKLSVFFCLVMFATVGVVIFASFTHFHPKLAFTFPPGAFALHGGPFFAGFGAGLLIAIYDYLGYNTTAYMAGELKDPGHVLPRSIIYSIVGMMVIYLCLNIGVLGVVDWHISAQSSSVGSLVMENTWGKKAAYVVTAMIVVTAFASVMTGILGGSRVPYNAAKDKLFFRVFAHMHPKLDFPDVSLLVMGAVMAVGCFFDLTTVINVLVAVGVLVQSVAQIAALTILRHKQPALKRPYKMFLYPLPSLIALAGWIYAFATSGKMVIEMSFGWLALGLVAFLIWAAYEKSWPFGDKQIREEFLEGQSEPR